MQKVSNEYKQSMKSLLRGRGYIKIAFGLINQEAQANATIGGGDFSYFSNKKNIFESKTDEVVYATLEEDFTTVDGNMAFLPRNSAGALYYDTGITSENLVSESPQEILIQLNILPTDFKGLTIDFGECYPVRFDIVTGDNDVISIEDNDMGLFYTEAVMEHTDYIRIVAREMKNGQNRLRVRSITFGYGLVYTNESVLESSLDSYISPIGADVPTIDFTVKLKNYDQYFNVDNPASAINFLETGQPMEIYYGLELDSGEIEWVKGNTLQCSSWEADDYSATIRSQDMLRDMDREYYRGTYNSRGISYYDLAQDVLVDAGITEYYIDPYLKNVFCKNPLPRVTHKEALQIIANAGRCVLSQTRDGKIRIKSSFEPDMVASANRQAGYSNVANILDGTIKDEYAELGTDYSVVDGSMYFLPRNYVGKVLHTGFVSQTQSGADGKFGVNPVITIVQEAQAMYYGVKFSFGASLPGEFIIRTYNNGTLVTEYTVGSALISKNTVVNHTFDDFDTMTVEFTKTANPYNRIVLHNFSFGNITDFVMSRNDMTSSPKAFKQELVKEVIVPCYSYQNGSGEELLVSEEITVTAGEIITFFMDTASYNYRAFLEGLSGGVAVVESGSFFTTLQFTNAGTFNLQIHGWQYKVTERYAVNRLNDRGKTVRWENPLISEIAVANDLARWLGEYYSSAIEYEYDTRGNPEIDVNDVIYQENDFIDNMEVTVYKQSLKFNQSFSGRVVTRRKGGMVYGMDRAKNRLARTGER